MICLNYLHYLPSLQDTKSTEFISHVTILSSGIAGNCLFFGFVVRSKFYCHYPTSISISYWIFLLVLLNLYFNVPSYNRRPTDDMVVVFYTIFVCYTMLPLSKCWSLVLGALTVVLQLISSGVIAEDKKFLVGQVRFFYSIQMIPGPIYQSVWKSGWLIWKMNISCMCQRIKNMEKNNGMILLSIWKHPFNSQFWK